jgi:RinA family phage transcriptional activator
MEKLTSRKEVYRKIEEHLKNYQQYKIGIRNLNLQLDNILPSITVSYEGKEGAVGTFVIHSPTEKCAIDRIESQRAIEIKRKIMNYQTLVDCIDAALEGLDKQEKDYVEYRYMFRYSISKIALTIGASESTIYNYRSKILEKLEVSLTGIIDS